MRGGCLCGKLVRGEFQKYHSINRALKSCKYLTETILTHLISVNRRRLKQNHINDFIDLNYAQNDRENT